MSIDIILYKWHKIKVFIIRFSPIIDFISVYLIFCKHIASTKLRVVEKHLHNFMWLIIKIPLSIPILLKYINMFNISSFRKRYGFFYNFKCIFRIRR